MFQLFKLFKRKNGEMAAAHKGWLLMGKWVKRHQHRYADWLQKKAKKLPARTVALWLGLLCLLMAICSTYILYRAVYY